jgi:hypothetical protein
MEQNLRVEQRWQSDQTKSVVLVLGHIRIYEEDKQDLEN